MIAAEFLRPSWPARDWAAVIFTSETGVMSARRIAAEGATLPQKAFCVGDQTARMARDAGFQAVSAQGGVDALESMIKAHQCAGPLLYLHGAEVRGDLARGLHSVGIDTFSAVSYEQKPQPLTPEATETLQDRSHLIAPVFSARTGKLLMAEYLRVGGTASLLVAGISAEAIADMPATETRIALRPDAPAMLQALDEWLA